MTETCSNHVDTLIVGGGTAGVIAGIASARLGARTLLLECSSQLGGVTTTGGVNFPGLFHAWGKQIIAGIGWELVTAAQAFSNTTLPDFTQKPKRHWQHQIRLNPFAYTALAEEGCIEAGVQLCYYESPVSIEPAAAGGYHVTSIGKGLQRRIHCKQLLDCTGGATLVGMLGLPRLREEETQPGTMMYRLEGYDASTLDADDIQSRYQQAMAQGLLQPGDFAWPQGKFITVLNAHGENTQHILKADNSTAALHTDANIRGRKAVLRLLRFIRTLPGCERAVLAHMSTEAAIRETWRIVGQTQITCEDYVSGRLFQDALCYSFYPIDLHTHEGVKPQPLKEGTLPTVPRGALKPAGSRDLLVAGRSVSSDRLANSALRVQASCMAMGQVAGTLAAMAAQAGCDPVELSLAAVRQTLRAQGAIVPAPDAD